MKALKRKESEEGWFYHYDEEPEDDKKDREYRVKVAIVLLAGLAAITVLLDIFLPIE